MTSQLKVEKINGRRGEYAVVDATGRRVIVQPTRDMAREWLKALRADPALRQMYEVGPQ